MKTKSVIIFTLLLLSVALTVGVSFAIWTDNYEAKANYTISADTPKILNVTVRDDATKLIPPKGHAPGIESQSELTITVEGGSCDLSFTIAAKAKKPDGVWISVPVDVLTVGVYDGANLITSITALSGVKILHVKAKFIKDIELIDPIFKNAELRYSLTVTPTNA